MFRGGFLATFMLSQWQAIQRELLTHGGAATAAYAGTSFIGLTLAGMLALQIKTLRSGKDFRSMDPETKEGRDTWFHAAVTGGGLGIYGDFIAADRSSYGHDLLSTFAGPMVTGAEDAYHTVKGLVFPPKKGREPGSDAVKFLRNNTPVLSTHWALQAAYNRILLDQLQYMADPQAHRKMRALETRLRKETGQGYWWRPGAMTPDRLPEFAGD
jgi:hypothetical protein